MKNIGLSILVAVVSSVVSVSFYRIIEKPKEIFIGNDNKSGNARFTNYTDALFSGNLQRTFLPVAPNNFIAAADHVTPTVVNIKALQGADSNFWGDETYTTSSGSGVIISPEGYIVTNNHVVEKAKDIEITLNDKRKIEAKVIGVDPSTDLALIKINLNQKLPYVSFGNSDSLRVGEWVLAVGNPFNLESTVTAGIVSAKGRSIDILTDATSIESFIQTDAVVNPGNSGGALVNTNGELIGINTAIITKTGRYEGYSFAVPSNLVQKVIKDLKDFGVVQRGFLGIGIDNIDDERAKLLGLNSLEGIFISRVDPKGSADEAGLQRGDVLVGVNGTKIKTMPELQEQVGRFRPGNKLSLDYIRNGQMYRTQATLKNKSNTTALVSAPKDMKILQKLGFELQDLTHDELNRIKVKGVKVVSIIRGSKIDRTNMDPGFIITKINEHEVDNIDDILNLLECSTGKVKLTGIYEEYAGEYYYAFPM